MGEHGWNVVGTIGAAALIGGMLLAAAGTPVAGLFFSGGLVTVVVALVGRQVARRQAFRQAEEEAARRHAILDAEERCRRRGRHG